MRLLSIACRFPCHSTIRRTYATMAEVHGPYKRTFGPLDLVSLFRPATDLQENGKKTEKMTLTRWQSQASGLRVVHVDTPGPIVNLYTAIATEIFNDSGIPHTLEHAIFLGSAEYPYKGLLDTLSNRALADGTNAWTAQNHTCYTISTAGQEGFLRMLPIYLDHVLYPTLTGEGFTTEVFHVNGQGEEAGVVFSEMQGRENGSGDLMALRQQRALYPKSSGLRSETGGLMEALRILDIDQIRNYHGSTYLPHNICVIVCGRVDPDRLLETLTDVVEPRIAKNKQNNGPHPSGWKRPWVETSSARNKGEPELSGHKEELVEFPEADESVGEWQCTWKGARNSDSLKNSAIDLIGAYLTDSPIAPLNKELVEIADPYCTSLSFSISSSLTNTNTLYASGVPTEHLSALSEKIRSVLSVETSHFDLDRMRMLIDREEAKMLDGLERSAADTFADVIINDFLHGDESGKDLESGLQDIKHFEEFRGWAAQDWASLLKSIYLDAPSLVILGQPSASLADKIEKETGDIVQKNKERFGKDGLSKLADKLKHAQEFNDRPIPDDLIANFKIPSVKSINWINVDSARSEKGWSRNEVQQHVDSDPTKLPYFIQFDHVDSNFLTITLHIFASSMPQHLKPLIWLYMSSFFSLPVIRSTGERLTFEQVVKSLDEATIEYDTNIGGSSFEDVEISFRVKKSNYQKAIAWMHDLLFNSIFDQERLAVTTAKNLQNLPSEKREGSTVASSALSRLTTDDKKSLRAFTNLLTRNETDPLIAQRLKDEPEKVVAELEDLRKHLSELSRMRISVAGDIKTLKDPKAAWQKHFSNQSGNVELAPIPLGSDVLSKLGQKPSKKVLLYSLGSIEGSYANFTARGPTGFQHPDRPALIVACSVLNVLEGFLWRMIRGAGLAYGASIRDGAERSLITFSVYRSPDAAKAFLVAKKLIEGLADGTHKIDQLTLDSAKGTLAYSVAAQESSRSQAAAASFMHQALRGVPQSYQRDLLAKAAVVTIEDCLRVIKTYLVPLFDPNHCVAGIASSKGKTEEIAASLQSIGFEVDVQTLEGADEEDFEGSESGSDASMLD